MPKRYDLGGNCDGESGSCKAEMVESRFGDYVMFDEYEQLQETVKELEKKIESAVKELS